MRETWLEDFLAAEGLPEGFVRTVEDVCEPLAHRIARLRQVRRKTVIIGLCGAQGSGKSTIAAATVKLLEDRDLSAVAVSLDDFYFSQAVRQQLAKSIHPLLATRGPPGTHDVPMASALLDQLRARGKISIPKFDKAADSRAPRTAFPTVRTPVDVVIFEGWCVGAVAQGAAALREPVNDLERNEDPDGRWRAYVNEQLDGPYQALFGKLHETVFLQAPSFEVVAGWRAEQEAKLRARTGKGMSEAELERFVAHYERLTRWMISEMPERANWTIPLSADRTPLA